MTEQTFAAQVVALAGSKFTEQTVDNLVAAIGESKVRQMFAAAQAQDGVALTRLRNRLFCASDRVLQTVASLKIQADVQAVMRAATFDANVIEALLAAVRGKQTPEQVNRIQQAFQQTAAAARQEGAVQAPAGQRSEGAAPAQQGRVPPQRPPQAQAQPRPSPQDARRQGASRSPGAANDEPVKRGKSKHVYGGRGALCFEVTRSRNGGLALNVDAAPAVALREYDWSSKTVIQLSETEMRGVLGVLFGSVGMRATCDGHGPEHDKSFTIEHQQKNHFVKVARKGAMVAVPVTFEDGNDLLFLLAEAIIQEHPSLFHDLEGLRQALMRSRGPGNAEAAAAA